MPGEGLARLASISGADVTSRPADGESYRVEVVSCAAEDTSSKPRSASPRANA
jgi:hypothetical protein